MRVGIYSRNDFPVASALAEGCREVGFKPFMRSLSDWKPGEREPFDEVFLLGLRGKGEGILAENPDAFVVDLGYMRRAGELSRESGYWQIGRGGLNCPPPGDCPPDRFDALDLAVKPMREPGSPVVLCLQVVGDKAHPFDTEEKMRAWVETVPHDEIRLHPETAPPKEPLDDMLARCGTVATWNSTVGIDALLAGVPVKAYGPAVYRDCSDREALFHRLAYGQWTMNEMASGEAVRYLIGGQNGD